MLSLSYQLARPSGFQVNIDGGYQAANLYHLRSASRDKSTLICTYNTALDALTVACMC